MQCKDKTRKTEDKKQLKPFIAPGSYEVITQEEIEKRKRRIERAEAIGLSIMHVTSEGNYDEEYENPHAVEALRYILNDMDVPEEVKEKMKIFDEKNKKTE